MDSKRCTSCGQFKPVSGFWRNSAAPDGLQSNCKDCRRASRLRTINRDKKRIDARNYYQRNQQHIADRMRGYYSWNRAAVAARNATRTMERQACEVCGIFPADAHHDDYTHPLDVRWLCRRHHREHHLRERMQREGLLPVEGKR